VEAWISGIWEPLANLKLALESSSTQTAVEVAECKPEEKAQPAAKPKGKFAGKIKAVPTVPSITVGLVKSDAMIDVPSYGPKRHESTKLVTISQSRWLTSVEAKKHTVEITFDLPDDFPSYVPGDSIGIYCPNPEVSSLYNKFKLSLSLFLTIRSMLYVRIWLMQFWRT
jgi:sulfite reductase alpha subunit-like flavoprotein